MKYIFLLYIFFEVIVTISIGGEIGALNTFFEILISAIIGFAIIINFRKIFKYNFFSTIMNNKLDLQQLFTGSILSLVGALFLIIPGFVSDFFGILLQINAIKKLLHTGIQKINRNKKQNYTYKKEENEVIDVEIIEHSDINK